MKNVFYLPEVLRDVVLQFALHQMTKQRLDLVEDALLWLIGIILNRQESLRTRQRDSVCLDSLCQTQLGLKKQMPSCGHRR